MTEFPQSGEVSATVTVGRATVGPDDTSTRSVAQTAAPSLLDYHATYLLIGLNLVIFLLMTRLNPWDQGVLRISEPVGMWQHIGGAATRLLTQPFDDKTLILFGSCVPERVLRHGEWWRLVTSTFVHVTLLHLLLNMWCLWNLGIFGERLLGKAGLIAVYLLTGAAGMLQSVLLSVVTGQQQQEIVAGASGAVFGLAGILIVLLSNRRLAAPWRELRSLRRQVVFFALANLGLGSLPELLPKMGPGMTRAMHIEPGSLPSVANSAHIGGLVCGILLGVPLFPRMTSGRSSYRVRQGLVFSSAALCLGLISYAAAIFERGH